MNWRNYWNGLAASEENPRRQVARIRANRDLGEEDISATVTRLRTMLDLKASDRLLDLCCGNGLLTQRFALNCAEVVGLDLSDNMIDLAKSQFFSPNIHYHQGDVTEVGELFEGPFDKILLQFSFQYLSYQQGKKALAGMKDLLRPGGIILLGDVPATELIRNFYPDIISLLRYRLQRLRRTDRMGKFWSEKEITKIAQGLALKVERIPQPEHLPYADYRVDYRLCHR